MAAHAGALPLTADPHERPYQHRHACHDGSGDADSMRVIVLALRTLVGALTAAILLLVTMQAVDRHLMLSRFDAYEHLARLALVWLVFLGYALGLHENANLRIQLLDHWLPARWVLAKQLVLDLLMLAVVALIHIKGWRVVDIGATQQIMGTPFSYAAVFLAVQVGTLLVAAVLIVRCWRNVRGRLSHQELAEHYEP
jgi:TRAP-type C4-dicarboxylate transport system permease small subunit